MNIKSKSPVRTVKPGQRRQTTVNKRRRVSHLGPTNSDDVGKPNSQHGHAGVSTSSVLVQSLLVGVSYDTFS